jgi:hypothetical protein
LRSFVIPFVVALLSAPVVPAAAQQPTPTTAQPGVALPILPGTRVRVKASNLVTPLIATYLEMRGDTAVFIESVGRGLWSLALDQITSVERSAGEQRRNRSYIVKSAAIGVPVGAFLFWGATGIFDTGDSTRTFSRGTTALLGAVVGGVVGGIIGTRFATEHWSPVPLPRRVSLVPTRRGGLQVGIGFSF